jgi:hypothetical protein
MLDQQPESNSSPTGYTDSSLRAYLESLFYTPEQIDILLSKEPQCFDAVFDSDRAPVAYALDSLGLESKARRHDDCGLYFRTSTCLKGHITYQVSRCGLSICLTCAADKAKKRIEKHQYSVRNLPASYTDMTYVELQLAFDHRPETTARLIGESQATFLSLLPDPRALKAYLAKEIPPNLVLWTYCVGLTPKGDLIIRLLCAHDTQLDHRRIRQAFAHASHVTISTCPIAELTKFFKFLFMLAIPKEPAVAAKMEQSFTRVRRLRTIGMNNIPDPPDPGGESGMMVKEPNAVTNTSDQDAPEIDPAYGSGHRLCPVCHSFIVSTSSTRLSDKLRSPHVH